jgi:hypothetical protein
MIQANQVRFSCCANRHFRYILTLHWCDYPGQSMSLQESATANKLRDTQASGRNTFQYLFPLNNLFYQIIGLHIFTSFFSNLFIAFMFNMYTQHLWQKLGSQVLLSSLSLSHPAKKLWESGRTPTYSSGPQRAKMKEKQCYFILEYTLLIFARVITLLVHSKYEGTRAKFHIYPWGFNWKVFIYEEGAMLLF